jgi:hypothetical protein
MRTLEQILPFKNQKLLELLSILPSHASHKFVLTCTYLHLRHDLLTFYYNNHRGWLFHVTYLVGSTKIGQRFNFILYCLFVELGNKDMYYIACTKLCKAKIFVGVWQCEKLISSLVQWVLHKSCERVCKGNERNVFYPLWPPSHAPL